MNEETKAKREKTYTEKQVEELLKKQIAECSESIDADNMSAYTAKRKILSTKIVKIG
jgi:hypothetical protein